VDGTIILKKILNKEDVRMWTAIIWHKTGTSSGLLKHGNEPLDSIKGRDLLA
jgi:hypothetical protein